MARSSIDPVSNRILRLAKQPGSTRRPLVRGSASSPENVLVWAVCMSYIRAEPGGCRESTGDPEGRLHACFLVCYEYMQPGTMHGSGSTAPILPRFSGVLPLRSEVTDSVFDSRSPAHLFGSCRGRDVLSCAMSASVQGACFRVVGIL